MSYVNPAQLLRASLAVAAVMTGTLAIVQILEPHVTARLLGLPVELLVTTGAFLMTYAALLIWLASAVGIARSMVWLIVAGNAAWGLACITLTAWPPSGLTALGSGYVLLQAVAAFVLAGAQALGLKRSPPLPPVTIDFAWKEPL